MSGTYFEHISQVEDGAKCQDSEEACVDATAHHTIAN